MTGVSETVVQQLIHRRVFYWKLSSTPKNQGSLSMHDTSGMFTRKLHEERVIFGRNSKPRMQQKSISYICRRTLLNLEILTKYRSLEWRMEGVMDTVRTYTLLTFLLATEGVVWTNQEVIPTRRSLTSCAKDGLIKIFPFRMSFSIRHVTVSCFCSITAYHLFSPPVFLLEMSKLTLRWIFESRYLTPRERTTLLESMFRCSMGRFQFVGTGQLDRSSIFESNS